MSSTRRPLFAALLLTASFVASACTAILVPDEDDDDVARCDRTDDCTQPDDNRWQSQCVAGEGQDGKGDKVCAPSFAEINCSPDAYSGDHPYPAVFAGATDNKSKVLYGSCDEENLGKQGCKAMAGACNDGLVLRDDGICDDPDAPLPAVYPTDAGGVEIAGQDVRDQFCRSYFCDESFVCDTSGAKHVCKPCSGTDPENFGEGGCGTLFIQGERSPAYTDLAGANCEGMLDTDAIGYGTSPEP